MKVMVTGAAGMLGRAVMADLGRHLPVVGVDLPDGDLTDATVPGLLLHQHRPDWVIHTAAYTDVDGAEREPARALAVNGEATAELARACARCGAGMTYISTDYVFSGQQSGYDEDDPREPINHYGASKASGEQAVEALADCWQIVRTSWLFGPGPRNFVLTIRQLLAQQSSLEVVDDQVGHPTYAPDLAAVLRFLVQCGQPGRYHATNRGACSWYDFARQIASLSGIDPRRIRSCSSSTYQRPARRPACSILRSRNLEALGCPERPTWQHALARYIQVLEGRVADADHDQQRA